MKVQLGCLVDIKLDSGPILSRRMVVGLQDSSFVVIYAGSEQNAELPTAYRQDQLLKNYDWFTDVDRNKKFWVFENRKVIPSLPQMGDEVLVGGGADKIVESGYRIVGVRGQQWLVYRRPDTEHKNWGRYQTGKNLDKNSWDLADGFDFEKEIWYLQPGNVIVVGSVKFTCSVCSQRLL